MFGGDRRRLEMAYSLMFALPGTPVIWYGEEIGMGDDLSQQERSSVRTPMQWSDSPGAGFSSAPPEKLVRPVISEGPFAYRNVNIAAQREAPDSLLTHMQRLVRTRRSCPEVGWGECRLLDGGHSSVLALEYEWRGNRVATLHNLSDRAVEARFAGIAATTLTPLLGAGFEDRKPFPADRPILLEPYGFGWYRAEEERR
jgi:maltose alpha-D-glucosyltransferase/alpha-amylase